MSKNKRQNDEDLKRQDQVIGDHDLMSNDHKRSKSSNKNSKSHKLQEALKKISQLEDKVNDLNNKLLMTLADYQNLVKSVERQKEQLVSIVKKDVFADLIELFTDLYVSIDALDDKAKDNPYIRGVLQIIEKYKNLLKKHGVDEISFKEGDAIDPNYMQVIAYEPSDKLDNKVFKVVEPGYKIGDYVLRPARVIAFKLVKQDKKAN